jgi:non-homologous end joining protein Ku
MLCEEHHVPLKQYLQCPGTDDAEPHNDVNIVRGVEAPDGWVILTTPKPTAEEVKPEIDKKALNLYPIPASEVEANTVVGESIYYLAPSTAASYQVWAILAAIVKKGKGAFTPNEKMYRLESFRGYLVLRELVFPDKISETPPTPEVKVDRAMAGLVEQFVDNLVAPWDAFDSSDTNAKRFDAWVAQGKHVPLPDVHVKDASSTSPINLMETLRQAVENAKK